MAFREFTDSKGVVWRAWDVTTAQLHPATRGEDFMGNLQDGWLAFESEGEKRRMAAPYPAAWTELPITALEELCRNAPPASARRPRTESGVNRAFAAEQADRAAIADGSRTFTSPLGRQWTVRLHECLAPNGQPQTVLRFTADDIVVELRRWPAQWRTASMEEFALMLLDADPPRRPDKGRSPQRRREDRPVEERSAQPRM